MSVDHVVGLYRPCTAGEFRYPARSQSPNPNPRPATRIFFVKTSLNPTIKKMSSVWRFYALAVLVILSALVVSSKTLTENEQAHYGPDLALMDDDGSLDAALINYLFARQMVRKLQNNMDVTDLQRKRSYWKQCAFNAVSCFGGK